MTASHFPNRVADKQLPPADASPSRLLRVWRGLRRIASWWWHLPEELAMRRLGMRLLQVDGDAILLSVHGQHFWTTRQHVVRGLISAMWYQNYTLTRAYTCILRKSQPTAGH